MCAHIITLRREVFLKITSQLLHIAELRIWSVRVLELMIFIVNPQIKRETFVSCRIRKKELFVVEAFLLFLQLCFKSLHSLFYLTHLRLKGFALIGFHFQRICNF